LTEASGGKNFRTRADCRSVRDQSLHDRADQSSERCPYVTMCWGRVFIPSRARGTDTLVRREPRCANAREYSFSGAVAIRANLRRPNRHPRHPPENPRRIDPLRDDPLQLQRAGTIVESLPPGGKRRHRRGDRPGICASSRTRAVSSRTTPRPLSARRPRPPAPASSSPIP
jgi:hypothetical protein